MPNTYEVVGTCDPDGTLRPYGTTAPKAPGHRNDPIVVGKKYILASGAHTGGTAIPEATCLAVNGSNALMITHGLYAAVWPGSGELDISSYMGGLSVAVDDVYLARVNGGSAGPSTTTPTGVSVYNGSVWSDDYSNVVKDILADAASNYTSIGGSDGADYTWLGTSYDASNIWFVTNSESFSAISNNRKLSIAPTFILDLTRVQISGAYISLANPEGQIDAHNVTYGDSDVDSALTELNQKIDDKIIVYADGTKTVTQLLYELYTLIDVSKLTPRSGLIWYNGNIEPANIADFNMKFDSMYNNGTSIVFTTVDISVTNIQIRECVLEPNTSRAIFFNNGSRTDYTTVVATGRIEFMY